jgi:hypothetical protein
VVIILIISAFETTLFPQSLFLEDHFNPALEAREGFQLDLRVAHLLRVFDDQIISFERT